MLRLSVAIQHHPRRRAMVDQLVARLASLPRDLNPYVLGEPGRSFPRAWCGDVEVVADPEADNPFPSPWRTYRHALERTPADATHRLVLQDDVTPCDRFLEAVEIAVAARPHRLLSFFHGGQPSENVARIYAAGSAGDAWAVVDPQRWCPAVALCWPAGLIPRLLEFVDRQDWPETFRADDEIFGHFLRDAGEHALASVPSLVEHADLVPSLVGRRAAGGHDLGRVAACPIRPTCDPVDHMDWTRGAE